MKYASFAIAMIATLATTSTAGESKAPRTELGKLAASMKPGEWKELVTQGFGKQLLTSGRGGILPYADSGAWEAKTETLHFVGQGHLRPPPQHVIYTANTNSWRRECPQWLAKLKWFHGYENTCADPVNGLVFHNPSASNIVRQYDVATRKWTQLPNLPGGTPKGHGTASTFFPEMGAKGSIVRFYTGSAQRFDMKAQKWSKITGDFSKAKSYHNVAEYNPKLKVVLFGGGNGSKQLYVIDKDGKTRALKEAPCWIGSSVSHLACCPASGELVVISYHRNDKSMHALDLADQKAEWRKLPEPPFHKGVITTVSSYDCIVLFNYQKVMVYKHKPAEKKADGGNSRAEMKPQKPAATVVTPASSKPEPQPARVARPTARSPEKICTGWFSAARNYSRIGMRKDARRCLNNIIKAYPDSEWAARARREIAAL
jgi:hypothetical protein